MLGGPCLEDGLGPLPGSATRAEDAPLSLTATQDTSHKRRVKLDEPFIDGLHLGAAVDRVERESTAVHFADDLGGEESRGKKLRDLLLHYQPQARFRVRGDIDPRAKRGADGAARGRELLAA